MAFIEWLFLLAIYKIISYFRLKYYSMKHYNNPAELFDEILKTLTKDYNEPVSLNDLGKVVYKYPKSGVDKKGNLTMEVPLTKRQHSELLNVLSFLYNEKLIAFDKQKETAGITASGFIKIKTKSFQDEIEEKRINNCLQRIAWIVTPLAAIITVFVMVYKFFHCTP